MASLLLSSGHTLKWVHAHTYCICNPLGTPDVAAKHVCVCLSSWLMEYRACVHINGLDVQECVHEVQLHGIKNKNNDSKLLKELACTNVQDYTQRESVLRSCSIH